MKKTKVALIYGGKSGEHEISLRSAASVFYHLNLPQYELYLVAIDKDGQIYQNNAQAFFERSYDALPVCVDDSKPIPSLICDKAFVLDVDVVFPVVHGLLYEDGALQGVLEHANIAYVGCDVLSSAIGMDKDMARRLVQVVDGVKQIPYQRMPYSTSKEQDKVWCEAAAHQLGFPLFVKPCCQGSSVGISRVDDVPSLIQAVQFARQFDVSVIVESAIQGREIELAVIEHEGLEGLPDVSIPGEIIVNHQDGFYSYQAKYIESEHNLLVIPAVMDENLTLSLQRAAADIFMQLNAKGYARVDFFVEKETNHIYFNEINTLPGFTTISMFPKLWHASGLGYQDLLAKLIRLAQKRQNIKAKLMTDYQA